MNSLKCEMSTKHECGLDRTYCTNCGLELEEGQVGVCEHCARGTESGERDELRPATSNERHAAFVIHGETDIEIDDNAVCAEGSEGVWVAAWVWVSNENIKEYGDE